MDFVLDLRSNVDACTLLRLFVNVKMLFMRVLKSCFSFLFVPQNKELIVLIYCFVSDMPLVYDDKNEAFKMLKRVRESRVKSFKTYEEAHQFSKCGLESPTELEIPVIISTEINGHSTNSNNCDKNTLKRKRFVLFCIVT